MTLPSYTHVVRDLPVGDHPYLAVLPGALESPGIVRIHPDPDVRRRLIEGACVQVKPARGFAFIDVDKPCIVLATSYLEKGSDLDLYLDLLHELTHLRQLEQGFDLWDDRFDYVDRPTEIEGYAVAIAEGRRLGMTEDDIVEHLSSPWLGPEEVKRLYGHICGVLDGGPVPNWDKALEPHLKTSFRPW